MILQVHDELLFDTPLDEIEQAKVLIHREMEAALPLKVPSGSGIRNRQKLAGSPLMLIS